MARHHQGQKKPLWARAIQLVCCLFFGIMLLVLAPKTTEQHQMYEERCTAQITGTVTDTRTETVKRHKKKSYTNMKSTHTYYYFTVTYSVDGRSYSKEERLSVQKYARNDTLTVHYAPDDPNFGYVEGFMPQDNQKLMQIIGVVVIAAGVLFFFIT